MDYTNLKQRMDKSIGAYEEKLSEIRAGRANPAILNKIKVEYYGTPTPINQMAGISVPEARLIVIQPWDASILKEIEKEILKAEIGINPNNDGRMIRLNFPELTEERRKELVKEIKKMGEEAKVTVYGKDGSRVVINPEEFAGYDSNNNKVFWMNGDEFHMKKSVVEEEITLCGLARWIGIETTEYNGIGIVPLT